MYSPKIQVDLIPKLYQIAKAKKQPMTAVINKILKRTVNKMYDKLLLNDMDSTPESSAYTTDDSVNK